MKILSWNVQGLRNPRTICDMFSIVRLNKPHLIFLSESLCHLNNFNRIKNYFPLYSCFHVPPVGRSGCLLLFWLKDNNVQIISFSSGHIDSFINYISYHFWFTGFYGNLVTSQRHHSWKLLQKLSNISSLPWIIWGDFNEIIYSHEKKGGNNRSEIQMMLLGKLLIPSFNGSWVHRS